MPNHVKNRLSIKALLQSEVAEVLEFIKGGDLIDFNKIVPRSKDLDVTEGNIGENGLAKLHNLPATRYTNVEECIRRFDQMDKQRQDEALIVGEQYYQNIQKHGYPTWYSWSLRNWGTKWNAYDISVEDNVVEFDTAWSCVAPLIQILADKFPKVAFLYEYSDEDIGCNCGSYLFFLKDIQGGIIEDMTVKAYELAFKLRPDAEEYYKLDDDGEYQYVEGED